MVLMPHAFSSLAEFIKCWDFGIQDPEEELGFEEGWTKNTQILHIFKELKHFRDF